MGEGESECVGESVCFRRGRECECVGEGERVSVWESERER